MAVITVNHFSGGANLTPNGSSCDPDADLASILRGFVDDVTQLRSVVQAGTGTLVAGTFTVSAGVTVTATSRIVLTPKGTIGTTTNFAGLSVSSRTSGAPGVGAFTVQAILATGAIDNDAVGDVDWAIIDLADLGDQQNTKG